MGIVNNAFFKFLLGLMILLTFTGVKATENTFCAHYAQNSVLDHIKNVKSNCGFKGKLWRPEIRQHQAWCRSSDMFQAQRNLDTRSQQLDRCGRSLQHQLTWDELNFSTQNALFRELITAVQSDDIASLKLFEEQGVNLQFEWQLVNGGLLYWAISNQAAKVVRYLIEDKSANPNLTTNGGPNPLVRLLNNAPNVNYALLDYLLRHGARPNHGGEDFSDDSFPLITAVLNNDLQAAELLLKNRADPNLYESVPPLMVAVYQGNTAMVKLLLRFSANPNRGLQGLSCHNILNNRTTGELLPMDAALESGHNQIITTLLQRQAKTTQQCLMGY